MFELRTVWNEAAWPIAPFGGMIVDGDHCWLAVEGGLVELEIESGRVVQTLALDRNALLGARHFLHRDGDATVLSTLAERTELWRRTGVHPIAIAHDSQTFAVADKQTTEIWRLGSDAPVITLARTTANRVWLAPNGAHMVTSGYGSTGVLRRVADGKSIGSEDTGCGVTWDASSERVAMADRYGRLAIWSMDGSVVRGPERISSVCFAGQVLLARQRESTLVISPNDGRVLRVLPGNRLGVALDGDRVLTQRGEIFSLATGETLLAREMSNWIFRIALSPRGDRAILEQGAKMVVWDLTSGRSRSIEHVRRQGGNPLCAEFLRDGERVMVVSSRGVAMVIDGDRVEWTRQLHGDGSFSGARASITDDTIVLDTQWEERGPVESDQTQESYIRSSTIALGLDGAVREVPAGASVEPMIKARIDREIVVISRGRTTVQEIDVRARYGKPSAVAVDQRQLLIGTVRGTLLRYT